MRQVGSDRLYVTLAEFAAKRNKPLEVICKLVASKAIPSEEVSGTILIPRHIYDHQPSDNEWAGYRELARQAVGPQTQHSAPSGTNSWEHVDKKLGVEREILLQEAPADCFLTDSTTGEKFPDWPVLNQFWCADGNAARLRKMNAKLLAQKSADAIKAKAATKSKQEILEEAADAERARVNAAIAAARERQATQAAQRYPLERR